MKSFLLKPFPWWTDRGDAVLDLDVRELVGEYALASASRLSCIVVTFPGAMLFVIASKMRAASRR